MPIDAVGAVLHAAARRCCSERRGIRNYHNKKVVRDDGVSLSESSPRRCALIRGSAAATTLALSEKFQIRDLGRDDCFITSRIAAASLQKTTRRGRRRRGRSPRYTQEQVGVTKRLASVFRAGTARRKKTNNESAGSKSLCTPTRDLPEGGRSRMQLRGAATSGCAIWTRTYVHRTNKNKLKLSTVVRVFSSNVPVAGYYSFHFFFAGHPDAHWL